MPTMSRSTVAPYELDGDAQPKRCRCRPSREDESRVPAAYVGPGRSGIRPEGHPLGVLVGQGQTAQVLRNL